MLIIMVKKLVSVKMKLCGCESSHFEKKYFKVVPHILGIFIATTITDELC